MLRQRMLADEFGLSASRTAGDAGVRPPPPRPSLAPACAVDRAPAGVPVKIRYRPCRSVPTSGADRPSVQAAHRVGVAGLAGQRAQLARRRRPVVDHTGLPASTTSTGGRSPRPAAGVCARGPIRAQVDPREEKIELLVVDRIERPRRPETPASRRGDYADTRRRRGSCGHVSPCGLSLAWLSASGPGIAGHGNSRRARSGPRVRSRHRQDRQVGRQSDAAERRRRPDRTINMQVRGIIQAAYRVPANQLVNVPGGSMPPAWTSSPRPTPRIRFSSCKHAAAAAGGALQADVPLRNAGDGRLQHHAGEQGWPARPEAHEVGHRLRRTRKCAAQHPGTTQAGRGAGVRG